MADDLEVLEARLLDAGVRKDSAAVSELLAKEFVEFGSSGRVFDRTAVLEELGGEAPGRLWLDDFTARELADGVALVTYRSFREVEGEARRVTLRSSVWVRRSGAWVMMFHQGTVAGRQD